MGKLSQAADKRLTKRRKKGLIDKFQKRFMIYKERRRIGRRHRNRPDETLAVVYPIKRDLVQAYCFGVLYLVRPLRETVLG